MSRVIDEDLGLEAILRRIADMDGWSVSVGVHEQEDSRSDIGVTNANLAAIHEFGAGNVPERSFLRSAFDANLESYVDGLAEGAADVIDGTLSPQKAVGRVGEKSVADAVDGIRAGIPPPLAPSTVARKGSTKQLIDTGQLVQSIKAKTEKL